MLNHTLSRLLLSVAMLLAGMAASAAEEPPALPPAQAETTGVTADLIFRALSLIGVRYRRGGNSPETGLDCSGLVRLVFQDGAGIALPRRAEEISRIGVAIKTDELRPGDLVFYNTLRRTFSHVGIYLGEGRFIHAPSSGGAVRIEEMSMPYWRKRFNGARRVEALAGRQPELAIQPALDSPAPTLRFGPRS